MCRQAVLVVLFSWAVIQPAFNCFAQSVLDSPPTCSTGDGFCVVPRVDGLTFDQTSRHLYFSVRYRIHGTEIVPSHLIRYDLLHSTFKIIDTPCGYWPRYPVAAASRAVVAINVVEYLQRSHLTLNHLAIYDESERIAFIRPPTGRPTYPKGFSANGQSLYFSDDNETRSFYTLNAVRLDDSSVTRIYPPTHPTKSSDLSAAIDARARFVIGAVRSDSGSFLLQLSGLKDKALLEWIGRGVGKSADELRHHNLLFIFDPTSATLSVSPMSLLSAREESEGVLKLQYFGDREIYYIYADQYVKDNKGVFLFDGAKSRRYFRSEQVIQEFHLSYDKRWLALSLVSLAKERGGAEIMLSEARSARQLKLNLRALYEQILAASRCRESGVWR